MKQAEAAFGIKVQLASLDCLEHVWRVWPRNMDGQTVKKNEKTWCLCMFLFPSWLARHLEHCETTFNQYTKGWQAVPSLLGGVWSLLPGSASFAVHLGSRSPGHDQHQGLLFYEVSSFDMPGQGYQRFVGQLLPPRKLGCTDAHCNVIGQQCMALLLRGRVAA